MRVRARHTNQQRAFSERRALRANVTPSAVARFIIVRHALGALRRAPHVKMLTSLSPEHTSRHACRYIPHATLLFARTLMEGCAGEARRHVRCQPRKHQQRKRCCGDSNICDTSMRIDSNQQRHDVHGVGEMEMAAYRGRAAAQHTAHDTR